MKHSRFDTAIKAVWESARGVAAVGVLVLGCSSNALAAGAHRPVRHVRPGSPNANARGYRLDKELTLRAARLTAAQQKTRVIVELQPGATLPAPFARYANAHGRLAILNGQVVNLPNGLLLQLAAQPSVFRIHYDRPTATFNYRTALTTGTRAVQQTLGLTGAGVGVAVIDSGITSWHDDLTNTTSATYPFGNQRVSAFVDR